MHTFSNSQTAVLLKLLFDTFTQNRCVPYSHKSEETLPCNHNHHNKSGCKCLLMPQSQWSNIPESSRHPLTACSACAKRKTVPEKGSRWMRSATASHTQAWPAPLLQMPTARTEMWLVLLESCNIPIFSTGNKPDPGRLIEWTSHREKEIKQGNFELVH